MAFPNFIKPPLSSAAPYTILPIWLHFNAPESTTSEIQRHLISSSETSVSDDEARRSVSLLRSCDEAKFAGRIVEAEETSTRIADLRGLAEQLEERL